MDKFQNLCVKLQISSYTQLHTEREHFLNDQIFFPKIISSDKQNTILATHTHACINNEDVCNL